MTESYDLRSNLKNKPGAQGTLFQVKDKGLLNPQQRWPQGYTPERLGEIREATKGIPITPPRAWQQESSDKSMEDISFGYRDRVQKTIARSTVPAEHLEGLRAIHGHPDVEDHGTYWPTRREIGVDMTGRDHPEGDIAPESRGEAEKTLIHELGHHFHNDGTTSRGSYEAFRAITAAGTKHAESRLAQDAVEHPYGNYTMNQSRQLMSEQIVAPGVHEALADNYFTEHYRGPGRKAKTTTVGAYEENFSVHDREARYPGYNDVRPPQHLQARQFGEQHPEIPGLETKVVPNPTTPGYRRKFTGK